MPLLAILLSSFQGQPIGLLGRTCGGRAVAYQQGLASYVHTYKYRRQETACAWDRSMMERWSEGMQKPKQWSQKQTLGVAEKKNQT